MLWVAYSGGRDSTVLLHALRHCGRLTGALPPITAVHVDHGLHPQAASWRAHCARECRRLAIPLRTVRVDARPATGQSPEAAARDARYAALAGLLGDGDWLLTAHHRDDQAETLLLQLVRGSGPRGLAAMPLRQPLGRGTLVRPLLDFDRAALAAWATGEGLDWVEDPSNRDQALDRNFVRHSVLPLLKTHWPAVDRTLARAADHQQDASALLDALAEQDLEAIHGRPGEPLPTAALIGRGAARARNLLRYWLRRSGLPAPPARVLQRVFDELLPAGADRNPRVHWPGAELRRYRGRLYALVGGAPDAAAADVDWDLSAPLAFAGGLLTAQRVRGAGLRARLCGERVSVRRRRGGERCRATGRRHHQALKKLIQQAGLPPWERPRLPLIYADGELVQAVGLCIADGCAAAPGEPGVLIEYHRAGPGAGQTAR